MSKNIGKKSENIDINSSSAKEIIEKLQELKEKTVYEELKKILNYIEEKEKKIPISCFKNKELGILEAVVKFLKENKKLDFEEIARTLNRSYTTISNTYRKAKEKQKEEFKEAVEEIAVDPLIFSDRNVSPLYSIIAYLKDSKQMRFSQIAKLLSRDQRNIASTYHKYKKK